MPLVSHYSITDKNWFVPVSQCNYFYCINHRTLPVASSQHNLGSDMLNSSACSDYVHSDTFSESNISLISKLLYDIVRFNFLCKFMANHANTFPFRSLMTPLCNCFRFAIKIFVYNKCWLNHNFSGWWALSTVIWGIIVARNKYSSDFEIYESTTSTIDYQLQYTFRLHADIFERLNSTMYDIGWPKAII